MWSNYLFSRKVCLLSVYWGTNWESFPSGISIIPEGMEVEGRGQQGGRRASRSRQPLGTDRIALNPKPSLI
jgi:hypothetical protein